MGYAMYAVHSVDGVVYDKIFYNWNACQSFTKGKSSPIFKGFDSIIDAQAYFDKFKNIDNTYGVVKGDGSVEEDDRPPFDLGDRSTVSDTSQNTLREAYRLVYKDIVNSGCGLFVGRYDAKNGSRDYMDGIGTLMEFIADKSSEKDYEDFQNLWFKNRELSESKASVDEEKFFGKPDTGYGVAHPIGIDDISSERLCEIFSEELLNKK